MMAGETISDGHGNEIVVYNYYAYAYYDYTVYKSHYYEIACEEFNYHTPEIDADENCGEECPTPDPSKGHFGLYPYTCESGQTHEKVFVELTYIFASKKFTNFTHYKNDAVSARLPYGYKFDTIEWKVYKTDTSTGEIITTGYTIEGTTEFPWTHQGDYH